MLDTANVSAGWWPPRLPLVTAIVPSVFFFGLTYLAQARWPQIDSSANGYFFLTIAIALPLLSMCVRPARSVWKNLAVVVISSFTAVPICLQAGLCANLVRDLDAGLLPDMTTMGAALGVVIASISIPIGLLLSCRLRGKGGIYSFVLITSAAGALGQLSWFGLARLIDGPSGIEYWMLTRALIHGGAGSIAGILAGSNDEQGASFAGPIDRLITGLPDALAITALLFFAFLAAGTVRVIAESHDDERFITIRLDEYYLALSNLRVARMEGLAYPELYRDFKRSRRALLGSASFDPDLPPLLDTMLEKMEDTSDSKDSGHSFKTSVIAVDRHLMDAGVPFFLEPHELRERGRMIRFVLRYRIASRSRTGQEDGDGVIMLRLRRMDDLLVDTPFAGISYPGIGTVLMDRIDDTALKVHGRLFTPGTSSLLPDDGKFAQTRAWIRGDKKSAVKTALAKRGHVDRSTLRKLAYTGDNWAHRSDVLGARKNMDAETLAAYDALADILAVQTEVHEARHALDGDLDISLAEVNELRPGPLADSTVAEIRAYLTEIIDGPLGPGYGLAVVCDLLAGKNARAHAYFFSSMVIMEGLWGDPVRKPDTVTRESPDGGPVEETLPIGPENPGWLSFSRINACYAELRSLEPQELQKRARALYHSLFGENYRSVQK